MLKMNIPYRCDRLNHDLTPMQTGAREFQLGKCVRLWAGVRFLVISTTVNGDNELCVTMLILAQPSSTDMMYSACTLGGVTTEASCSIQVDLAYIVFVHPPDTPCCDAALDTDDPIKSAVFIRQTHGPLHHVHLRRLLSIKLAANLIPPDIPTYSVTVSDMPGYSTATVHTKHGTIVLSVLDDPSVKFAVSSKRAFVSSGTISFELVNVSQRRQNPGSPKEIVLHCAEYDPLGNLIAASVRRLGRLGKITSANVGGYRARCVKSTGQVILSKKALEHAAALSSKLETGSAIPALDGRWISVDCSIKPVLECGEGQNACLSPNLRHEAADDLLPMLESTADEYALPATDDCQSDTLVSTGCWIANTSAARASSLLEVPKNGLGRSLTSSQLLPAVAPLDFLCMPLWPDWSTLDVPPKS